MMCNLVIVTACNRLKLNAVTLKSLWHKVCNRVTACNRLFDTHIYYVKIKLTESIYFLSRVETKNRRLQRLQRLQVNKVKGFENGQAVTKAVTGGYKTRKIMRVETERTELYDA